MVVGLSSLPLWTVLGVFPLIFDDFTSFFRIWGEFEMRRGPKIYDPEHFRGALCWMATRGIKKLWFGMNLAISLQPTVVQLLTESRMAGNFRCGPFQGFWGIYDDNHEFTQIYASNFPRGPPARPILDRRPPGPLDLDRGPFLVSKSLSKVLILVQISSFLLFTVCLTTHHLRIEYSDIL